MSSSFEPRTLVNGGLLKQFAGQLVSIMLRVELVAGTTMQACTTDSHKVRVSLPTELNAHPGAWIEVIGRPSNAEAIRAKEVIEFGGENIDFDIDGYNGMVHLLNNVKTLYRYG